MRLRLLCLPLLILSTPLHAQGARIDSFALRGHTYFLAHDLLEGRGTGTRGADAAALYLAAAAERLGLRPAGDSGTWFQSVPIVEATITSQSMRLTIGDSAAPERDLALRPEAFLYNVGTASTLIGFGGRLVFVGSASEVLARPERLPPLRGRVAVLRGVFGADGAAADTLRARGATGVLHLIGSVQMYALYVRSRGPSRLYIDSAVGAVHSFIPDLPSVIVHPAVDALLLGDAVTPGSPGDTARVLAAGVNLTVTTSARRLPARNVAALLPGSDRSRSREGVAYTAHYDHLGISDPDEHGDSLYNGFSDNAAGSAMLLAIAEAMATAPPARSVLFLWFTGEERGLLGSDYYVARPTVPLARIRAVINLDAGAPPAPSVQWRVAGGTQSTLGDLAIDVARRAGWSATVSALVPNSDYFPYVRSGVPAVFLVPGPGAYENLTSDSSNALRRRWDRYHQASDHWYPDFPFGGLVRYADYALRLGIAAAQGAAPRIRD